MNEAWYISRATGIVAYVLLFLVVALGLAIRTRGLDRAVARWRVTDLHAFGSLLALSFVFAHAASLLWDTFVGYSIVQILVPFTAATRTFWTGVGIITAYLFVVIVMSFAVRRWIGYRSWRGLHYSTFGLFVLAALHGIFTGTDSAAQWMQLLYVSTGAVVLALTLYRIALYAARRRGTSWEVQAAHSRALNWGVAAFAVGVIILIAGGVGPFHWFDQDNGSAGDGPTTSTTSAATTVTPTPATGYQFDQRDHLNRFRPDVQ